MHAISCSSQPSLKHVLLNGLAVLLLACGGVSALAQNPNQWFDSKFVLKNDSTLDPSQIHITFFGAVVDSAPLGGNPQTYGDSATTGGVFTYSASSVPADYIYQSYTLDQFLVHDFDYGSQNGGVGDAYTFTLNNLNSGRVYISNQPFTAAPDSSAQYGLMEIHAIGAQQSAGDQVYNNWDISYVDGASIPMQIELRNTDGSSYSAATINPVTTSANIIASLSANMPSSAVQMDGTTVLRVNSPGNATSLANGATTATQYHDWSLLLDELTTAGTTLAVKDFTVPGNSGTFPSNAYGLSDALFGYAGGGKSYPGQPPDMLTGQSYDYSASFVSDIYTNATAQQQGILNANPTWGITSTDPAVKGAILTGSTGVTSPFTIYLTYEEMNAPSGIYGSNPSYIVIANDGTFSFKTSGIRNDVTGRIVGDLMAGMVFGWANSDADVQTVFDAANFANAAELKTGLESAGLAFQVPDPGAPGGMRDVTFGELTTGEFFALMSFGAANGLTSSSDPASAPVLDWIGSGIQSNSNYYDDFAYAVAGLSFAYGTPFGDRFEGLYSPDTTWYNYPGTGSGIAQNPITGEDFAALGYGVLTFSGLTEAGVAPEPSSALLLLLGSGAVVLTRRSRKRNV